MSSRETKLQALRAWLMEYMPQTPLEQRSANFITKKEREKRLLENNKKITKRAEKLVEWRVSLAAKLGIAEEDIVLASNTIVELLEQTLIKSERVTINGFGTFKPIYSEVRDQMEIRFHVDESYQRALNDPIFQTDIGLKRTYKKGKLERRT